MENLAVLCPNQACAGRIPSAAFNSTGFDDKEYDPRRRRIGGPGAGNGRDSIAIERGLMTFMLMTFMLASRPYSPQSRPFPLIVRDDHAGSAGSKRGIS